MEKKIKIIKTKKRTFQKKLFVFMGYTYEKHTNKLCANYWKLYYCPAELDKTQKSLWKPCNP
jgi:hypothetical protein